MQRSNTRELPRALVGGAMVLLILLQMPAVQRAYDAPDTSAEAVPPSPPNIAEANLLAYERARAQWRRLPRAVPVAKASETRAGSSSPGAVTGTVWKPIGPSPIFEKGCCVAPAVWFNASGRTNSIAVHPTNPDIVYLGSSGGGVWKTIDGDATWRPLTDQGPSLGIGASRAIAIDPAHPDTLYVGTSSYALFAQSRPRPSGLMQSMGILKSTDGGESWILLGSGVPTGNTGNAMTLFTGLNINAILIDPSDSNVLYLAAGRGGDRIGGGLFRSTDAGVTWTAAQMERSARPPNRSHSTRHRRPRHACSTPASREPSIDLLSKLQVAVALLVKEETSRRPLAL